MTWSIVDTIARALTWCAISYFALVNGGAVVQALASAWELWRQRALARYEPRHEWWADDALPCVSVIAPAHNEAATIEQTLASLLALEYPMLEIIVVNDGSADDTLARLVARYGLTRVHDAAPGGLPTQQVRGIYRSRQFDRLLVIDKAQGGKADALNCGVNYCTSELVCAIDADTLIEPEGLLRLARPFLADAQVDAVGGMVRVVNGSLVRGNRVMHARAPLHPLSGIQAVEYVRAFYAGRLGWNGIGGHPIVAGAFGLFRVAAVRAVGGYTTGAVGEDLELVFKVRTRHLPPRAARPRVSFVSDSVAWTEAPQSLRALGGQRARWHRGLADALWRHRRAFLAPRHGVTGMFAIPFLVVAELIAPVVEVLGWGALGLALLLHAVNWPVAALLALLSYGAVAVVSVAALLMEELAFHRHQQVRDRVVLVGWALLEPLGYRQLTIWWRLRGLWQFLRGTGSWGTIARRGVASTEADSRSAKATSAQVVCVTRVAASLVAIVAGGVPPLSAQQTSHRGPLVVSVDVRSERFVQSSATALPLPWNELAVRIGRRRSEESRADVWSVSGATTSRFGAHDLGVTAQGARTVSPSYVLGGGVSASQRGLLLPHMGANLWGYRRWEHGFGTSIGWERRDYRATRLLLGNALVERYGTRGRVSYALTLASLRESGIVSPTLLAHRVAVARAVGGAADAELSGSVGGEADLVRGGVWRRVDVRSVDATIHFARGARWTPRVQFGWRERRALDQRVAASFGVERRF
jgi:YaiO family outer membrane protein